jgi:hypothetical protein
MVMSGFKGLVQTFRYDMDPMFRPLKETLQLLTSLHISHSVVSDG